MRIAIIGSSGYIAGFLIKSFSSDETIKIIKIDKSEDADYYLDLCNPNNFDYSSLDDVDLIVFTAAISGPDFCATHFDLSWSINVTGTSYFIKEALKRNCRVLFFSSDAVFGDIPGTIYTEDSITQATTPYGRMKKAIEDLFKDNKLFKAIRLSYVVSKKDKFVSYCLKCGEDGNNAEVFHPFYRNCIVVSDVVKVVNWLTHHWDEYRPFVLNVAGNELVSRVRIIDEINRVLDNSIHYSIVRPNDDFYKNRPAITQMQSKYIYEYSILINETFTEKIKREMEVK